MYVQGGHGKNLCKNNMKRYATQKQKANCSMKNCWKLGAVFCLTVMQALLLMSWDKFEHDRFICTCAFRMIDTFVSYNLQS